MASPDVTAEKLMTNFLSYPKWIVGGWSDIHKRSLTSTEDIVIVMDGSGSVARGRLVLANSR